MASGEALKGIGDTSAICLAAVLAQLQFASERIDGEAEADDTSQLPLDVIAGRIGDLPRFGEGGLMQVRQFRDVSGEFVAILEDLDPTARQMLT